MADYYNNTRAYLSTFDNARLAGYDLGSRNDSRGVNNVGHFLQVQGQKGDLEAFNQGVSDGASHRSKPWAQQAYLNGAGDALAGRGPAQVNGNAPEALKKAYDKGYEGVDKDKRLGVDEFSFKLGELFNRVDGYKAGLQGDKSVDELAGLFKSGGASIYRSDFHQGVAEGRADRKAGLTPRS